MNIENIFECFKEKTRILVASTDLQHLLQFIISFNKKSADFVNENNSEIFGNDFLFYFSDKLQTAAELNPNMVLLPIDVESTATNILLERITGGGILIYPENNHYISEAINASENYFRKIPYQVSDFEIIDSKYTINTEYGSIILNHIFERNIKNLEGLRLLCQQIGIMEDEFYESLISFEK